MTDLKKEYWTERKDNKFYNQENINQGLKVFKFPILKVGEVTLKQIKNVRPMAGIYESDTAIEWEMKYYGLPLGATASFAKEANHNLNLQEAIIEGIFLQIEETIKEINKKLEKFTKEFIFDNFQSISVIRENDATIENIYGKEKDYELYNLFGDFDTGIENEEQIIKVRAFLEIKVPSKRDTFKKEISLKELVLSNKLESELQYYLVKIDRPKAFFNSVLNYLQGE